MYLVCRMLLIELIIDSKFVRSLNKRKMTRNCISFIKITSCGIKWIIFRNECSFESKLLIHLPSSRGHSPISILWPRCIRCRNIIKKSYRNHERSLRNAQIDRTVKSNRTVTFQLAGNLHLQHQLNHRQRHERWI